MTTTATPGMLTGHPDENGSAPQPALQPAGPSAVSAPTAVAALTVQTGDTGGAAGGGGTPAAPIELQTDDTGWFSDEKGGFWAFTTAALCALVVGLGHATLLAAALGEGHPGGHWPAVMAAVTGLAILAATVVVVSLSPRDRRPRNGAAAAAATAAVVLALFGVAWLASRGDRLDYGPVVGISISVVSVVAFGGFFLASRRARVAIAASFLLTFLVLFSFVLTLSALAQSTETRAVSDLLRDFRGNVGLIVAFYFGSDAAITVAKLWQAGNSDPLAVAQLTRGDRDIATPMPTVKS